MAEAQRPTRVLVVDDAEGIRGYVANLLELHGFAVDTAEDGRSALALLEGGVDPDVILLDVMMPGIDGLETLRRMRELDDNLPIVMLSVVGKAATIVEAMRIGASDFLNKPFEEEELLGTVEKLASDRKRETAQAVDAHTDDLEGSVWKSAPMRKIREVLEQISDTNITVLIQGESGVGKEVVARMVKQTSRRRRRRRCRPGGSAAPVTASSSTKRLHRLPSSTVARDLSVLRAVNQAVLVEPRHQRPEPRADLLHRMLGRPPSQRAERDVARAILLDEVAREATRLDVGQHLLHARLDALIDHPRPALEISVLSGVRHRIAHVRDAALVDQVDDELDLVDALEVRHLRRVAGLHQSLVAGHHERGQPPAQHGLLAEEIGLGLLLKVRLDDASPPSAPMALRVGERDLQRVAGEGSWPTATRQGTPRPCS